MARSKNRIEPAMLSKRETIFLLDVDNTLLDNDRFASDFRKELEHAFGVVESQRYWDIYQDLRKQLGYADYLAALQKFSIGLEDDPYVFRMSEFLLAYPFENCLYPRALDAISHLHKLGTPVVLSDGDVVFQPRKIQRSGIWAAVEGRVLIYKHKELKLASVQKRFPAKNYVMVDDKPQLLAAMKLVMGDKLTTVFVRQGHYAVEALDTPVTPPPDRVIEQINDLCNHSLDWFLLQAKVNV